MCAVCNKFSLCLFMCVCVYIDTEDCPIYMLSICIIQFLSKILVPPIAITPGNSGRVSKYGFFLGQCVICLG